MPLDLKIDMADGKQLKRHLQLLTDAYLDTVLSLVRYEVRQRRHRKHRMKRKKTRVATARAARKQGFKAGLLVGLIGRENIKRVMSMIDDAPGLEDRINIDATLEGIISEKETTD